MYSSLQTVIAWTSDTFGIPASTYPQAETPRPFAVVNRTGGACEYPHDYPRVTVQFWTDSDAEGEEAAFALARTVRDGLMAADGRINAVSPAELTQLGFIDDGGFVWQASFELATNIYENQH